jgi:hypothetical protein
LFSVPLFSVLDTQVLSYVSYCCRKIQHLSTFGKFQRQRQSGVRKHGLASNHGTQIAALAGSMSAEHAHTIRRILQSITYVRFVTALSVKIVFVCG